MNLANRSFKDNRTGQVVKVIDSFENIAILENREKIDTRRLLDTNYYTEQVDPSAFFSNRSAYNSILEKIKTIPTENIPDDAGEIQPVIKVDNSYRPASEDTAVVYTTVDDEKEELAKKYGISAIDRDSLSRQNEAFSKILGEEMPVFENLAEQRQTQVYEPVQQPRQETTTVDPIVSMFGGIKRPVDFAMQLSVDGKIPRLDFIEMMEESYEKSIIEYLAEEFTNNLLKNPQILRQSIAARIREMVYGKPKGTKKEQPKRASKPNAATDEKPGLKPVRTKKIAGAKRTQKKEAEQQ